MQAQLNLLASELRHLSPDALKAVRSDLQDLMKNHVYSGMKNLIDEVWKVCPDAFPMALTADGMQHILQRHTMVLLHDIIPARDRFDWDWQNYFDWDNWTEAIKKAHANRDALNPGPPPGPVPGPPAPPVNPQTVWVWATGPPVGFVYDEVPQVLLEDAEDNGLVGMVRVNGQLYTIKPKEDTPVNPLGTPDRRGVESIYGKASVERVASKLGLRDDDMFAVGYTRCADKVLKDVFKRHSSVEEFARANFAELARATQAGQKAKFRELLMNARTCDSIIRQYDGRSQKELLADDVLEMHAAALARQDYTMRTANYDCAEAISGLSDFLLPTKAVTDAAAYTNSVTKLRNNLRNTGGNPATQNTTTPNNRLTNAFVPLDQRKCYECGATGHLGKDCPERQKRKGGGKGNVTPKQEPS